MASIPLGRSGLSGWRWPSGQSQEEYTFESSTDHAALSEMRFLCLSIRVWRIGIISFLALTTVRFTTGLGYQTKALHDLRQSTITTTTTTNNNNNNNNKNNNHNNSSIGSGNGTGTTTGKVITDMNCSTNDAPTTYIPSFHTDSVFSIYCGRDILAHDIVEVVAGTFEDCMGSCSNHRWKANIEIEQGLLPVANQPSTLARPCEGVSFVAELLNKTLAVEWGWGGNCFLKYGPLGMGDLRPNPIRGVNEIVANVGMILS